MRIFFRTRIYFGYYILHYIPNVEKYNTAESLGAEASLLPLYGAVFFSEGMVEVCTLFHYFYIECAFIYDSNLNPYPTANPN